MDGVFWNILMYIYPDSDDSIMHPARFSNYGVVSVPCYMHLFRS